MKRQLPSQLMETEFLTLTNQRAPLSEAVRLAAQLMLQKAVELEVTEFLGRGHYERSPEPVGRGYRNGYEDKQVQTGEGPLHLKMPQMRDTVEAFNSEWLKSLVRRSDKLAALIPQLYVKGLSTRDIEAALSDTLEVEGVSKSTVSTLCGQLKKDFEHWQNRDLSETQRFFISFATGSTCGCARKMRKRWLCCALTGFARTARRCSCIWRSGTKKAPFAGRASSRT